jgi:hypothetical protein
MRTGGDDVGDLGAVPLMTAACFDSSISIRRLAENKALESTAELPGAESIKNSPQSCWLLSNKYPHALAKERGHGRRQVALEILPPAANAHHDNSTHNANGHAFTLLRLVP